MSEIGDQGYENQSRAAIMWTLGGVSAAYFINPAVQAAAREDGSDGVIVGWFRALAEEVKPDIRRKREAADEDNIQYWQGFAILPTALLAGDPELLRLSRSVFNAAMHHVTQKSTDPRRDGFLPLELERGNKSLHYQAYATYPLLGLAAMSQAYGCDFLNSRWKRRQIANLMTRTMEGVLKPSLFTDELVLRRPGKRPIAQRKSYTVRHSPELLYLVYRIDPRLYERIYDTVEEASDLKRPVLDFERGETASVNRMGGRFLKLADTAEYLKDVRSTGLAEACRTVR
jgi:hypothetical protein